MLYSKSQTASTTLNVDHRLPSVLDSSFMSLHSNLSLYSYISPNSIIFTHRKVTLIRFVSFPDAIFVRIVLILEISWTANFKNQVKTGENSFECLVKGVIHIWRHAIFNNFLTPHRHLFKNQGLSAFVTKSLIPPPPWGRNVIYGRPQTVESNLSSQPPPNSDHHFLILFSIW